MIFDVLLVGVNSPLFHLKGFGWKDGDEVVTCHFFVGLWVDGVFLFASVMVNNKATIF
jgi:uncharacterized protein YktB (UPF0637 family)